MGLFDKKELKIIAYKDNNCAVLIQYTAGGFDEFNKEFSNLTSEGYELKTTYVPPHSLAGFNTTLGSFFYFQKLDKSKDDFNESHILNSEEKSEMKKCPKCQTLSYKKWCTHCGSLTKDLKD